LPESSQHQLEAWQALSMGKQAARVADPCGLSEAEIQRLASFYEGVEA
jgi:hypothetical protein